MVESMTKYMSADTRQGGIAAQRKQNIE